MGKFKRFNSIAKEFASIADFLIIYIEEAHPSDGWGFKYNVQIATHRSVQDRLNAASQLAEEEMVCPMVVDDMDDAASTQYGGLFDRLYVVKEGVVVYEGGRGPLNYKVEEVEQWLINYRGE